MIFSLVQHGGFGNQAIGWCIHHCHILTKRPTNRFGHAVTKAEHWHKMPAQWANHKIDLHRLFIDSTCK